MLTEVIRKYFQMTFDEIIRDDDIILSMNRARGIVTFYDGQFKEDASDDFLYFIMYDPVKHRVILVNRMTLNDRAVNTRDEVEGFVVSHMNETDITWVPERIYKILGE